MSPRIQNDLTTSKFPDAFIAQSSVQFGTGTTLAVFGLADTTGTALDSTALPASLDFSKFNNSEFLVAPAGAPDVFAGTINLRAVPEPSLLVLAGTAALAGLGGLWSRRRNRR